MERLDGALGGGDGSLKRKGCGARGNPEREGEKGRGIPVVGGRAK